MRFTQILLLASLLAPHTVAAQPIVEETSTTKRAEAPGQITDEQPLKRSYLLPAVELTGLTFLLSVGAQIYGAPWADISWQTMKDNMTSSWVWDEDPFTIDQMAHPYGGAMLFGAARSTGHGFWISGAYAFGGSLIWEVLYENEPPSLNDQITTPIAGALLGETFHRIGRALRDGNPGVIRRTTAALIDPMGEFNRQVWGKAWRDDTPWSYYAHLGLGYERVSTLTRDTRLGADRQQFHTELVLQHGLPGDHAFKPRYPYDHFDLRAAVDFGERVVANVDVRGLLIGDRFGSERFGGIYGLYGTYDFTNQARVRVSAIGVGPGVATELAIGQRGFLRLTAAALAVPWGAAGGDNEEEMELRDYHRGPGLAQIAEAELGRRDLGAIRVTSRLFEIDGTLVDDSGTEFVSNHTLGGTYALARNHSIGVEGTLSLRRATFMDDRPDLRDRTVEARVFYALTTGK
ncbi:MAG TPA: DUF3943 domain-containing protein [Kofleriaceae bacterium]